jgi:cytochrome c oxidase assembly factor CtaG
MSTWDLLTSCWWLDPLALAACLATAIAYATTRAARLVPLGGSRTRDVCRAEPRVRRLPLAVALLVLVLALASPIGRLADGYLFSAHMLQHLLLVLIVPPLALLGAGPGLRSDGAAKAAGRAGRLMARPLVAWGLGVGAMWLWHERTLCDAASHSAVLHRLQEVSLLAMGTAFWWPILAPREQSRLPPLPGVLYLFTACVACTLLGILITFSPVEVCSIYAHPVDRLGVMTLLRDGWGLTAAKDQQVGGLLMWVPACLVYAVGILGVLGRLFREGDARGEARGQEVLS